MTGEHGEPWRIVELNDGWIIVDVSGAAVEIDRQRAERIVACINAMGDISNPAAIPNLIKAVGVVNKKCYDGTDGPVLNLCRALCETWQRPRLDATTKEK